MKRNDYFYTLLFLMIALLIFGFSSRSVNVLEVAPVGHWTFDGEGNIAIDQSHYKSHGKLQGNPTKADGIVGKGCLELDGDGDYVEILENGKTPSQFHNLHKGSISIWFKARSIPKETSISITVVNCPSVFFI